MWLDVAGKRDMYARIRAYINKEHPEFEYDATAWKAYASKPYAG